MGRKVRPSITCAITLKRRFARGQQQVGADLEVQRIRRSLGRPMHELPRELTEQLPKAP